MRKPKREYIGILYCLPYVVVFLFGMIIPMFYALYLSFFKQSLLGGPPSRASTISSERSRMRLCGAALRMC